MRRPPVVTAPLALPVEPSKVGFAAGAGYHLRSLVAAAIAIGRMPGEPAVVLRAGQRPLLLALLFGRRRHGPLADPRLEVIRAISAALSRGVDTVRADLITDAAKAGWSRNDLVSMFPTLPVRAAS